MNYLFCLLLLTIITANSCNIKNENAETTSIVVQVPDKDVGVIVDTNNNLINLSLGANHNPRIYGSTVKIINNERVVDVPANLTEPVSIELSEKSIAVTYTLIATYARANFRIITDHDNTNRSIVIPMLSNEYCPIAYYGNIMPLISSTDQLVIDFNECPTSNSIKFFIKSDASEPNVEGEYNLANVQKAGCWVTYQEVYSGFGQYGQSNKGKITILKHDIERKLISGYLENVAFTESEPTGITYVMEGEFYNIPIR